MEPLHEETLSLVKEERRLTGLVIENLQKISDQRLFLRMGYSTMFDYCTKALGYSESGAYRRISAARLAKEIPEIKEKLTAGVLNLTNITMMQSLSSSAVQRSGQEMTTDEKRSILKKIENCSKREAQEILSKYFPDSDVFKREFVRFLSGDEAVLHIRIPIETLRKLDQIKSLRAHKNPKMNYAEVIEDMCNCILKKIGPELKTENKLITTKFKDSLTGLQEEANPRYIPQKLRMQIYQRDQTQCTFIDENTKKRCTSKHLLQVDHIQPVSRGGQATLNNLRLLCQAHHKYVDQFV